MAVVRFYVGQNEENAIVRLNQKMLANLERTIELIKKLREEEKLQSLAQRADELKAMQDGLNREMETPEPRREDAGRESTPRKDEELSAEG